MITNTTTEVPTASEPDGTETDGGSIESGEAPDDGQAGRTDIPKIEVRLIVEDPPIELVVSKVDENGDLLGGCELSLHEWDGSSDGNIGEEISTWTSSGDAAETITGIEPGRYVLVEDTACDGYDIAVPVEFEVVAQSEPNQVEMVNKKSTVADEEINISEPEPPSFIEETIAATGGMPVLVVLASVIAVAAFVIWLVMRRKKI